jgi:hypothetical protein
MPLMRDGGDSIFAPIKQRVARTADYASPTARQADFNLAVKKSVDAGHKAGQDERERS